MTDPNDVPTVWRMLLGERGAFESAAFEDGVVFVGFGINADLKNKSEDGVKQLVEERLSGLKEGTRRRCASQLNMLSNRMRVGDLVAVAQKRNVGRLAIGRVTGEYKYESARVGVPHTRKIEWIQTDIPISPKWDQYLSYLVLPNTINPIGDSETVEQVLRFVESGSQPRGADGDLRHDEDHSIGAVSVHDAAQQQIASLIHERFPGKAMERLVAGILEAEGYTIGPLLAAADQGVDVLAGYGLLGFEPPLMCVQVKHEEGPTRAPAVQQLRGAVEDFGAQQGLFVSWGGYTRDAEREARKNFFRIRLWNASDLIEAVCRNYERLSTELRAEIPLRRIWTLAPEDSES